MSNVVANFLDVPVGTVRSRLHRAKRQFRKEMIQMVQNHFEQAKLPDEFVEQIEKMRRQTEACMKNLSAIGDALKAYQQEHQRLPEYQKLPDFLLNLHPRYLKDLGTLTCPTARGEKIILTAEQTKREMTLYYYGVRFDSVSRQFGSSLLWPTRYDIKEKERQFFGDAVSIVRCVNHPESLHLSFSGEIYESEKHPYGWERTGRCIDEYLNRLEENLCTAPELCWIILVSTKMTQAPDMNDERFYRLVEILKTEIKSHPEDAWAHRMLIIAHLDHLKFADAARYFEKAIPVLEKKRPWMEMRASEALMYEQLGQFYYEAEDYPRAIQGFKKAFENYWTEYRLEDGKVKYSKNVGSLTRVARILARVYVDAGQPEEALKIANKMGDNNERLASIYEAAEIYEEAIEAYQQAIQMKEQQVERWESRKAPEQILHLEKESLAELQAKIAICYERLGNLQKAEEIRQNISPSYMFRWFGRTAPDFTLPDINGQPVRLSQFRGKLVLLHLWLEGATHIYDVALYLDRLSQKYKGEGLVVLEINQLEGHGKVEAMEAIRDKISHLTLWDGREVFQTYGTHHGHSAWVLGIDRNGILRYYAKDIQEIEPMIKKLLAAHSHR